MTEKRRFSAHQRVALYLLSGGRCLDCRRNLPRHWHADHRVSHVHGGPTDVLNGAALCPACNLRKGATDASHPERFAGGCEMDGGDS